MTSAEREEKLAEMKEAGRGREENRSKNVEQYRAEKAEDERRDDEEYGADKFLK